MVVIEFPGRIFIRDSCIALEWLSNTGEGEKKVLFQVFGVEM